MRYKCCLQGENIASVKKTVDVLINFFDREDVQLKKRVEEIEDPLWNYQTLIKSSSMIEIFYCAA